MNNSVVTLFVQISLMLSMFNLGATSNEGPSLTLTQLEHDYEYIYELKLSGIEKDASMSFTHHGNMYDFKESETYPISGRPSMKAIQFVVSPFDEDKQIMLGQIKTYDPFYESNLPKVELIYKGTSEKIELSEIIIEALKQPETFDIPTELQPDSLLKVLRNKSWGERPGYGAHRYYPKTGSGLNMYGSNWTGNIFTFLEGGICTYSNTQSSGVVQVNHAIYNIDKATKSLIIRGGDGIIGIYQVKYLTENILILGRLDEWYLNFTSIAMGIDQDSKLQFLQLMEREYKDVSYQENTWGMEGEVCVTINLLGLDHNTKTELKADLYDIARNGKWIYFSDMDSCQSN